MKLFQALKTFGIGDSELTRKELKSVFRKLTLKNHPDHGGDEEVMRKILEAFAILKDQYSFNIESNKELEEDENFWNIDNPEMEEAFKKIFHFKKLKIEICGYWMWVTGETFNFRKELKQAGLFYAKKKVAWYWKPPDDFNRNRKGNISLDKIREKYGSKELKTKSAKEIN